MADYQLTATDIVIRNADGASIPASEANPDYRTYLTWVAAGGVPDPYVPPPTPPPQAQPETTVLYDHENRLRVIEGAPPLSLGDFVDKMKGDAPKNK